MSAAGTTHPSIEGPLLAWVLERLSAAPPEEAREVPGLVLHAECGDGRVVEAFAARGLDARGADPRSPVRADGDTRIVAAGALEYLGATLSGTLDGLLLTGVVDRLRPGEGRALAQLAARCLAPGGVVVLVSARPEAVVAMDPVAADLAHGRPCTRSRGAIFSPATGFPCWRPLSLTRVSRTSSPSPRSAWCRPCLAARTMHEDPAGSNRPGHSLHCRA